LETDSLPAVTLQRLKSKVLWDLKATPPSKASGESSREGQTIATEELRGTSSGCSSPKVKDLQSKDGFLT
jgi:hypothetical protein